MGGRRARTREEVLARYQTPPLESPRSRRLRHNNRRRALQRFDACQANNIARGQPNMERFNTPEGETPLHRRRRLTNRSYAFRTHSRDRQELQAHERRLQQHTERRRNLFPKEEEALPNAMRSLSLAMADSDVEDRGRDNNADDEEMLSFPTYAQLATALRNLSLPTSSVEGSQNDFPTFTQLSAALRNLSPEIPSVDVPPRGFPSYAQLADSLRNLSPEVPANDSPSQGFPSYAQLVDALRNLPYSPTLNTLPCRGMSTIGSALATLEGFQPVPRHVLPPMDFRCLHCGAMMCYLEKANACCLNGSVKLAPQADPPQRIRELYATSSFQKRIRGYNSAFAFTSTGAKEDYSINRGGGPYTFRVNGSMHHRIGQLLPMEGATPAFAQIYVYDGNLEQEQAVRQMGISTGLDERIVGELQSILYEINPLAKVYKSAREFARSSVPMCLVLLDNPSVDPRRYNQPTVDEVAAIMVDGGQTGTNRDVILRYRNGGLRRIFESHPLYDPLQYPLLYLRGEVGWCLHTTYVDGVRRNNNTKVSIREHTAHRLYFKHPSIEFSLVHRAGRLFQQWCVDMAAKIIEQRLLFHRRMNTQQHYRRDLFSGLQDMLLRDHIGPTSTSGLNDVGTHVILSSSFPGSERYMRQQYYDAMAVVRQFGKPDLFVTVTTNPKWKEIQDELLPGQTSSDRPDIVTRVFRMKLNAMLDDITKNGIFGKVAAFVYVVEFQKRGLPHAHILILLKDHWKPRNSSDYDKFVSAEIPDPELYPELHATVTTCMIHGPCGRGIKSPCTGEDGECSKRFPKAFLDETRVDGDGYPLYRRRKPGPLDPYNEEGPHRPTSTRMVSREIQHINSTRTRSRRESVQVDNRWVVPYNPYLCQKYDCHVNVEVCSTVQSVKYLYKYVYKGQDRATVVLRERGRRDGTDENNTMEERVDEIKQYLDARYLSPPEACWTIFKYEMQKKSHHVHRLPVHDEDQQHVHFPTNARIQDVIAMNQFTKLTAFFELCRLNGPGSDIARSLLYHEVPIHFVWVKMGDRYVWQPRQRGGDKAIGRLISVSPRDINRYYLRLLLCYRRGPRSFEDLKTVDGVVMETYKTAALALGFLESDEESHRCLLEASAFQMPRQLRHLFAVLLVYCEPASPRDLWEAHIQSLCEDFQRDEMNFVRSAVPNDQQTTDTTAEQPVHRRAIYLALRDIHEHLLANGQNLEMYFDSLPQFSEFHDVEDASDVAYRERNRLLEAETSYNHDELAASVDTLHQLNADQKAVFDKVTEAVFPILSNRSQIIRSGKCFFLDGPGGTGKSFLLEKILAYVRQKGGVALAVAGSGIAAQLLTGGRTAHSAFKLPLDPHETSTCNIGSRSFDAALLKRTNIIVWDEAPMTHRFQYEALDRTLQDLMKNNMPFGGITMLLCGDFRQTLPVIPRAGPAEVISSTIKRSELWRYFEWLRLSINMRVQTSRNPQTAAEIGAFADYLLQVGDGRHFVSPTLGPDFIKVPEDMLLDISSLPQSNIEEQARNRLLHLVETVYTDLNSGNHSDDYFADRIILTPKNTDVLAINNLILEKIPGEMHEFTSVDSVDGDDELQRQEHGDLYPPEFLNTISLSGMPPHKLCLKVGTPVMLIRNLNTKEGLCNGTRLRIVQLRPNCMEAAIMGGAFAEKRVIIPRIALVSKNSGFPFELRRKQFPVQVAFAMTINKSQGQSIQRLGLYLPEPVFSHGQFYVAMSRVTSRNNIVILVDKPTTTFEGVYTKNIVYREIVAVEEAVV